MKKAMATIEDTLPEDLLLHIISFLPTLEAIRTCLISPKWRTLWHSLPSLHFDFNLFPPSHSLPRTRDLFANFVTQTLARRPPSSPPLQYFGLRFHFTENRHYHVVPAWINYAVNHGAVELDLDFHGYTGFSSDCCINILLDPLIGSQVRALKLRNCYLTLPDDSISAIPIVSLRSIVLTEVFLMDALVCRLMSLCVNLESLVIEDCVGPENLKICSSTLLELSLWNFEDDPVERVNSVEIRAPNLCSLSIICLEMGTFSLDSSPCIIEANVKYASRSEQFEYWSKVVRSLTGVMSLTTHNWWFELLQTKDVLPEGFAFNNLVYFDFDTVYTKNDMIGLGAFLELCPKLEMVIMDYDD